MFKPGTNVGLTRTFGSVSTIVPHAVLLLSVTNSFVKMVQNGAVSHPTQRSFSVTSWDDAFAGIAQPTTSDVRLHETGTWIFQKLETIRRALSKTWVNLHSERDHLLMFAAGANRDCHLLSVLGLSIEPDSLVMEQVIQATIEQPYGLGPAKPDAVLLSSVDSLRFPLQMIYATKHSPLETGQIQDLEVLGRIRVASNLGQFYSMLEGYWMHALWNGWYIDSKSNQDGDLILPPNGPRPIIATISEYRREALTLESIFHLHRVWTYDLTEQQRRRLLSNIPEVCMEEEEQGRSFHICTRTKADSEAMTILQKGLQAERGFYLPLVHEPLSKLGPVSLNMLLKAWNVLYALAERLMETFPAVEDSGVFSIEKLLTYAPTIKKQELKQLVISWCRFSEEIAEKIIDFFSYGPRTKWELWGHPLIKVGNDELALLMAPIRYGNIERTFELWMKYAGLELSDKGPLFENYARAELEQSLSRSELLQNAAVHATKVIVHGDDGEEEIDVVIRLNNKILLGEAKCLLFPAEPIEMFRYFGVLEDARSQVLRKAEFVRRNLSSLASQLSIVDVGALVVEPFILVNQPFGAGWPQENIPVVDEWILKRFFDGKWHRFSMYNEANELQSESTLLFYQSEEEAAAVITSYLKSPPQLRHYRQNVKPSIQWYPAIDEEDHPFATVHFDVVLPLPSLDLTVGNAKNSADV